ncbi:hypothetical protein SAMN05518672_101972 [Chitinophaga sp. CF118]|uniref:EboA domain-containing protein n=1 Tax=Chitinophaga sp. CF118 TaxID=1884367 RepID=UPI0008E4EAB3|nr:EboA domain-containing protein [Chitinophaga sp. CF118]SFD19271.1 hypothetical protein SAMN05518672_101972 [Chitinophaga sp. CF118]
MNELYHYDRTRMDALLYSIIERNSSSQIQQWLQQQKDKLEETGALQRFNLTFTAIPRFTGKNVIQLSASDLTALALMPGFFIQGYALDKLARIWWLLQLSANDREQYIQAIESLFNAADMNELVALYSALPLLAWPEEWKLRTAEGIRSNIGSVQDAIMLNNPYPASWLDEAAWNQLVMKAIFTDKPVHLISGLDERANPRLAMVLHDYAHERWAAGRPVNPLLWRLIGPFIDEVFFRDIINVWNSGNDTEKEAAALACAATTFKPAQELLSGSPALKQEITGGRLTWDTIARRIA